MGMLWTDNGPKQRAQRLTAKLFGSPFFPLLAYSKLLEAVLAGGTVGVWVGASVIGTVGYIIGEDFIEYISGLDQTMQEYLNGE